VILLAVKTNLLSAEEWSEQFRAAGFTNVAHERIVDSFTLAGCLYRPMVRDAAHLRAFKSEGALLIHGTK